jgi:ribosomal protein S18 acetylase RimI-like enzyme
MTPADSAKYQELRQPRIRPAHSDELRAIFGMLVGAYVEHQWVMPSAAFRIHLGDIFALRRRARAGGFLVAERNGRLVGAAMCDPRPSRQELPWPPGWASLLALAVTPEARWQGIGRTLLASCAAQAQAERATALCLHTSEAMASSIGFVESLGLVRVDALDFDLGAGHGFEPGATVSMRAYAMPLSRDQNSVR